MAFHYLLGRIGRKKRRECAAKLSESLKQQLANGDKAHQLVTDPGQLAAFTSRPFSPSLQQQLDQLRRRIQRNLAPEQPLLEMDSEQRGGRLLHLKVEATRIPSDITFGR